MVRPRSLIAGGLIVVALVVIYIVSKKSPVTNTPAGGVSVTGSPSATTPLPPTGVPASVATVPVDASGLVKKIVIIRDVSTIPGAKATWFNLGEVYAYEGPRLLTATDYSDAIMFPGVYLSPGDPNIPNGAGMNAVDGKPETSAATNSETSQISSLTLVLKNPTRLTQVNVLNRQDCCWNRLEGSSLVLYDSVGGIVLKKTLRGVRELQLFPVQP